MLTYRDLDTGEVQVQLHLLGVGLKGSSYKSRKLHYLCAWGDSRLGRTHLETVRYEALNGDEVVVGQRVAVHVPV